MTVYDMDGFRAACNSLKAGRLELLMARIFGTKSVGHEGEAVVTIYHWRGKSYLIDFKVEKK